MSKTEFILIVVLIVILVGYIGLMSYIMMRIYLESKGKGVTESVSSQGIDINSPYQTDFFNKSAQHAEKVLFGKTFIQEYGEPSYYGNKLLDVLLKINNETKKSIVIAIKYMTIEPSMARNNERLFRMMAEQEKVPVWFIILREATKKVVPELITEQQPSSEVGGNVVPLFKVA